MTVLLEVTFQKPTDSTSTTFPQKEKVMLSVVRSTSREKFSGGFGPQSNEGPFTFLYIWS